MAIYQKPKTNHPHPQHKTYPYLLQHRAITKPNQVWCADITYIPMKRGFLYLVAIMDWHSRAVLSWRLSNTMEADLCVPALEDAITRFGVPEIFNTDLGSQFTRYESIKTLRDAGIRISMGGRGRWMDNVMIERLWKSLKYECVYLRELETGSDLRNALAWWFDFSTTVVLTRPLTAGSRWRYIKRGRTKWPHFWMPLTSAAGSRSASPLGIAHLKTCEQRARSLLR